MVDNSKTPVMILQELMVKIRKLPEFKLVGQRGGAHEPIFEYNVTANNITATGLGRTKKDAKQDAANNVLKKLEDVGLFHPDTQFNNNQDDNSLPDWLNLDDLILTSNYVGDLIKLCVDKFLPPPIFNIISAAGPDHSRKFTMECVVGTVTCTKTSKTKKLAKQLAGKEMLSLLGETADYERVESEEDVNSLLIDDEAIAKYEEYKEILSKRDPRRKIIDYPVALKQDMKPEILEKAMEVLNAPISENVDEHIEQVLKKLEIEYTIDELSSSTSKIGLSCRLKTDPPFEIAAFEETREMAKVMLVKTSIEFLKTMLS